MAELFDELVATLCDVARFAEVASGIKLRSYQAQAARAIVDSVVGHKGLSFVVIFPRQSGKNELQAQIEAYLLTLKQERPVEMVKISPTWKPQALNAMRRLERVLRENRLVVRKAVREAGHILRLGEARMVFLSGAPESNIVGATASLLLECDEAQDVSLEKWNTEISPMAASTNATRVLWGTAWTTQTLLAEQLRAAQAAERQDGLRRVFRIDAERVGQDAPRYWAYVQGEIRRLGASHPSVRSQYFSEEIDGQAGMFPEARRKLMFYPPAAPPSEEGGSQRGVYAFLLDVGGEATAAGELAGQGQLWPDEAGLATAAGGHSLQGSRRDASALTVVQVDPDPGQMGSGPTYHVIERQQWTGTPHVRLYEQLKALVEHWQPRWIVCDSTGIGAGLASFLERSFPKQVIRVLFNSRVKSDLGWGFLEVIDSGRYREALLDNPHSPQGALQALFIRQLELCELELLPGPGRRIRWGVPDGRRDPRTHLPVHDDLLISAALIAELDKLSWGQAASAVLPGYDPLRGMAEVY